MIRVGLLVTAITLGVVLGVFGGRRALAAEPSGSSESPAVVSRGGVEIDVVVGLEIDQGDQLMRWLQEEIQASVDEQPQVSRFGTLRVRVSGMIYDYQVEMSAAQGGELQREVVAVSCTCSTEELLARVREWVPKGLEGLEAVEEEPVSFASVVEQEPVEAPTSVADEQKIQRRRLGPLGIAGVAMMSLGVGGVTVGASLTSIDDRTQGVGGQLTVTKFRAPGVAVASVSGAVLLAGVATFIVDVRRRRTRRRPLSLVPSFGGRGGLFLAMRGEFY